MFQDFQENNKDDDYLNEFRQRLSNRPNIRAEEKQKDLQRSKSVFLGAIAGVGLACVVGWFALSPKDGTSEKDIPVVRRPSTAVKIKPAEPGGMEILNQDKTVYDIIDKSTEARSNVEQLLPPPEEPKLPEITPETVEVTQQTTITDIIDNIDGGEIVVKDAAPAVAVVNEDTEDKTITIEEASKTMGETVKTEEKDRDYTLPENRKNPEEPKDEPKEEVKIDNSKPSSAPAGSWQIQLMSSKNKSAVEKAWKPTVKKHSGLANLSYEIEKVDLQFDGTFYRLKAGAFSKKADADAVCNKIKTEKGSCIVKKK